MNTGGWTCECGNALRSDQLTCNKCGKKYKLDSSFTHMEYPEPPLEEWAKDLNKDRTFSDESMQEVLEESRKRAKQAAKTAKRSGKKRFGIF